MTGEINTIKQLAEHLQEKGNLKQDVYESTLKAFNMLRDTVKKMAGEIKADIVGSPRDIPVEFTNRGDFEFELKFAGDVLIFMMHTNIFEFSRYHEIMKTPYIRKDLSRSYCGIINIYNFLADSFKYNRVNDIGYLIGRIFINRDNHFFIEGKNELNRVYQHFGTAKVNQESMSQVVMSAILYTINFDLLTPPYEEVKEVTVYDMQSVMDQMQLKTGKRLGFRFQADDNPKM